jgi:hypothetical protein
MEQETIDGADIENFFDSPRPQPQLSGPLGNVKKPPVEVERGEPRDALPAPKFRPQPAAG